MQEAHSAPELAQALNSGGREASRLAVVAFMRAAQAGKLLGAGNPDRMAAEFLNLAVGDRILQHLLGLAQPETEAAAADQARLAAEAVLMLHPPRRRR